MALEGQLLSVVIPPVKEDFFKNATRGHFYRRVKSSITERVDADVLAWRKGQGKGYQKRINAILREPCCTRCSAMGVGRRLMVLDTAGIK